MRELSAGVLMDANLNPLYALSFMYYIPVGACLGIFVGLLVSFFTGGNNLEELDPDLITPCLRRFLPEGTGKFKSYYRGVSQSDEKQCDCECYS